MRESRRADLGFIDKLQHNLSFQNCRSLQQKTIFCGPENLRYLFYTPISDRIIFTKRDKLYKYTAAITYNLDNP